jgi:peroxiredoxin Q/BCP
MKLRTILLALFIIGTPLVAAAAGPELGAPIPDFEFHGEDGVLHRRADTLGKRGVVIAWFPKAFTPG